MLSSTRRIIEALRPQLQELVNKQVELARTEMLPVGRKAGIAIGLLVTGAVFLLLFLGFFFLTGMYVMYALGFPLWVAAGINAVLIFLIGGGGAGAGAGRVGAGGPKTPPAN